MGKRCCASCGVAAPKQHKPLTTEGQVMRDFISSRKDELAPHGISGTEAAVRMEPRFLEFLQLMGYSRDFLVATPEIVVDFLISLDVGGHTVVHLSDCRVPLPSSKGTRECDCPLRFKASSLSTARGTLQGLFRDKGLHGPWDPLYQRGNPCISSVLDDFLNAVEKEQLQGRVATVQSALIDVSVYRALMDVTTQCVQDALESKDLGAAARFASDAVLYSLLWGSGLRLNEGRAVKWQEVLPFDAGEDVNDGAAALPGVLKATIASVVRNTHGGWYIHPTVLKTGRTVKNVRRVTVFADGSGYSVSDVVRLYQTVLDEMDLPYSRSFVFRSFTELDDGTFKWNAAAWTKAEVWARFAKMRAAAGIPEWVTLHSFHGSRAAREAKLGIPREVTCHYMGWSEKMYAHYVDGREPLVMDKLKLGVIPSTAAVSLAKRKVHRGSTLGRRQVRPGGRAKSSR